MRQKTKHTILASCYDKRGRLLSQETNSYTKSHPIQAHFAKLCKQPNKIYLHAEIAAILAAGKRQIHTIHIERHNKNGNPALAKPCKICEAAILAYGIKHIIYSTSTP